MTENDTHGCVVSGKKVNTKWLNLTTFRLIYGKIKVVRKDVKKFERVEMMKIKEPFILNIRERQIEEEIVKGYVNNIYKLDMLLQLIKTFGMSDTRELDSYIELINLIYKG